MKVIVYTPETEVENETEILSKMLDAGADHLYIRKPQLDDFSLVDYMEQFDPKYYPKIITTSLIITKEFDLGGYHFTRDIIQKNERYNEKVIGWLHAHNKISSVSAHSIEEIKKFSGMMKHVIASPIFKSISKEDHSYEWDKEELLKIGNAGQKDTILFAVGGVDLDKISEIKAMHFGGFGLLGALWKDAKNAMEKFEEMIKINRS